MKQLTIILCWLVVLLVATPRVWGVKIADVTRIHGQQNNILTGVGLVYGLKGTGDGGDYLPAIRPLQAMLSKYNNPATIEELGKTGNVALVTVTATLPSNGVRRGDRVDVFVMSMGAATSLRGGRLVFTPLTGRPGGPVFGLAEGAIILEDSSTPTTGLIKQGLIVEEDLQQPFITGGQLVTLVVEDSAASWGLASTISKLINDAESPNGQPIATAVDPRTIEIIIPESERERPDGFIARIQRLPLPVMPQEARVMINTRTSTIIVTGDVEISPVVISYKGLTIQTVTPKPVPTPRTPIVTQQTAIPLETPGLLQGGARLQDLVAALEQLRVPAEDRINIVRELHKSGKLHAKLVVDGVQP
jgi:flagellar P-ring protein precursor FlgI